MNDLLPYGPANFSFSWAMTWFEKTFFCVIEYRVRGDVWSFSFDLSLAQALNSGFIKCFMSLQVRRDTLSFYPVNVWYIKSKSRSNPSRCYSTHTSLFHFQFYRSPSFLSITYFYLIFSVVSYPLSLSDDSTADSPVFHFSDVGDFPIAKAKKCFHLRTTGIVFVLES